jgi:hypothetical protein
VVLCTPKEEVHVATAPVLKHKHVRIDQAKLEKARRLLEAATDTEALDRALTLVVSEGEIDAMLRKIGGKGSLKKVFR